MKSLELVSWKRNENMSNIYASAIGGDEMFLRDFYVEVFEGCANVLKDAKLRSFVEDAWQPACDNACRDARDAIAKALRSNGHEVDEGCIERVTAKLRGNLGEMLVEMLAENGILDFIKPGTYKTVDPTKEEFFDATAERNGLPIGIQVKNYSKFNKVKLEVFLKAAAQSDLWLRHSNVVGSSLSSEFIATPCQYVISTSDVDSPALVERFRGSVVFLGPKWIDSKRIAGSLKTGESAKWRMFAEVASELKKLK